MSATPPTTMLFERPYTALVFGAGGAIGSAFDEAFQSDPLCQKVVGLSRSKAIGLDLNSEHSIKDALEQCRAFAPFDVMVDATGVLTLDGKGPEKSLSSIDADHMHKIFQINTFGPALILKHFSGLLSSGPSIYAKLSARVGSIADNKKGGWYAYRSSKAAFNMVLQSAALELQRKNPEVLIMALQPGTVKSNLSQPFAAGLGELLSPKDSVTGLLKSMKTMRSMPAPSGACFIDHQGHPIPW